MSNKLRVLVVDDSALMRKLIPQILAQDNEIEVVGTAMDGAFGLKKIEDLPSDREELHQALADYAIEHAGTDADLDEELEGVSLEEAIEEIALRRAIDEGQNSPPASRDEVIAILGT